MTILVVDDDDDIRHIAARSLERVGGHAVFEASNGLQAFEIAESRRPDLVLMDVMMPGLDGLAAAARLRALPHMAGVPIVFLTARLQAAEVSEYFEAGAAGVIEKPFDPLTLNEHLSGLLERGAKP